MKRIKIYRYTEVGEVSREAWKELISALVLVGYEVIGDEDRISFKLGKDDIIEEEEENNENNI